MSPPAAIHVIEAAARAQSVNNLRQFGIGLHNSRIAFDDRVPPVAGLFGGRERTLFHHLGPYLAKDTWRDPELAKYRMKFFVAPGDPTTTNDLPLTSYASNFSVFGKEPRHMADVLGRRAEADVACFVERYGVAGGREHRWADPADGATWLDGTGLTFEVGVPPERASNTTAHAWHGVGLHVGLADGSARLVEASIAPAAFARLFDPKAAPE